MKISIASRCLLLSAALASTELFVKGHGTGPCLAACEMEGDNKVCRFDVKVNLFAGELGYFHVEQCGDEVNPTLGIEKDVTYYFSQKDESNYYHPLGFAYKADGAHDDVDELEPVIKPSGSNSDCEDDLTCPAPMYIKNGVYVGEYSNNVDVAEPSIDNDNFGLDDYEPEFFLDAVAWNQEDYSIALKFDVDDFTQDIFYFCHIHQYMTGRMKFVDGDGVFLSHEDTPIIPYSYDEASDYDKECGTYNLDEYQLPHAECPSKFVCDKPDAETPVGKFANCLESMNCAMTVGMTSNVNMDSSIALFIHQMIPHHQNAVNMCKALMKTGDIDDCGDYEDETVACTMRALCYEIINGQNFQIQTMRGVLDSEGYDEEDDCKVIINKSTKSVKGSKAPKSSKVPKGSKAPKGFRARKF